MIDRAGLAGFLRRRRESMQPEDVGLPRGQRRRTTGLRREEVATFCFVHPELGVLDLACQALLDPDQSHSLLVYTAVPGTESYDKLQLLAVIGPQPVIGAAGPHR
ncbi:hypothetical protein OHA72_43005 [Dactylosporangium sp. NBC_01737]|uniref:MmyB family transcriptional regulator n=1 Tax=Dactylosporangium sp. NBC_01737 TaxID=2975959 RepID=UPI002E11B880|nr:hypothetical protein OHA72_43005 [Dactylosporangium sp. NBC_01737]